MSVILAGSKHEWDAPFIHELGELNQGIVFQWYKEADAILFMDNEVEIGVPAKLFELIFISQPILYISHGNRASEEILAVLEKAGARFEIALQNDIDSISKAITRLIEQSKEKKEFKVYTPSELGFETQEEGWIKLLKSSIHGK